MSFQMFYAVQWSPSSREKCTHARQTIQLQDARTATTARHEPRAHEPCRLPGFRPPTACTTTARTVLRELDAECRSGCHGTTFYGAAGAPAPCRGDDETIWHNSNYLNTYHECSLTSTETTSSWTGCHIQNWTGRWATSQESLSSWGWDQVWLKPGPAISTTESC